MVNLGELQFDISARQLFASDKEIEVPRRELSMLELLTLAEGRLTSKTSLLEHAYGTGADVEESVVEVYISRLRRRLKPFGVQIRAQRGLGYQLIVEALK